MENFQKATCGDEAGSNLQVNDKESDDYIEEAIERFSQLEKEDLWRVELRNKNSLHGVDSAEPDPFVLLKREKSVAKVQRLVSRLRRFSDANTQSILNDLNKLDVTMHLSEVSDALCDCPLKQKDVVSLVEICSLLKQQYGSEFSLAIVASIQKSFKATDTVTIALASKRRSLLRLLVELILVNVIQDGNFFLNFITELCQVPLPQSVLSSLCEGGLSLATIMNDTTRKTILVSQSQIQFILHNIGTIEFLLRKFHAIILGKSGKQQQKLENALGRLPCRQCELSKEIQQSIVEQITQHYNGPWRILIHYVYSILLEQINVNQARRINKGVIDAESEAKYNNALTTYTRFRTLMCSFSDYLCLDPFTFCENSNEKEGLTEGANGLITYSLDVNNVSGLQNLNGQGCNDTTLDVWEDETEKDFYTNLLNLGDAVSSCLLGLKDTTISNPGGNTHALNEGECSLPELVSSETLTTTTETNALNGTLENSTLPLPNTTVSTNEMGHSSLSVWEAKQEYKFLLLDQFILSLCKATLASEVDNLAIKFFYDQLSVGKVIRRRLVTLLMATHPNDLHVLPSIARFFATIGPFCKDMLQILTETLPRKFKELVSLKDPLKVTLLIKTARFLSELCKFRLIPSGMILEAMNDSLEDFSQTNIETACHLIQGCGRFLLGEVGVETRLKNIVQKMMKLKNNRNLPIHLELMVEDSYYQLFPSERHCKPPKQLPLSRQFINWLIFDKLHQPDTLNTCNNLSKHKKCNLKIVCTSLRRLNWDDNLIPYWIKKAIMKSICCVSFTHIGRIAQLLCSLVPCYPDFVIFCIDDLFESLQLSLEKNNYRDSPQRIRAMKLLGEFFNFRLINFSDIYQTVYQLIGFSNSSSYGCHTLQNFYRLAALTNNTHLLVYSLSNSTNQSCLLQNHDSQQTKHITNSSNFVASPLFDPMAPKDDSDDFFRIKLICALLNVCGQYFSKNHNRQKMDRFLLCLRRYIHFKNPLPISIYHEILDLNQHLRPKSTWDMSLEEIDLALCDLLQKEISLEHENNVNSTQNQSSNFTVSEESLDKDNECGSSVPTDAISDTDFGGDNEDTQSDVSLDQSDVLKNKKNSNHSDINLTDDSDDDHHTVLNKKEKTEEEIQREMFDFEFSQVIVQSLQEAKPSFGMMSQRSRLDTLLEDVRLPPMPKLEPTDDIKQDQCRVRLVTRKGNNTNKVTVKLVDIPKDSRLCQAVYTKETKDVQEHERLKRFVIDTVARHQKQEVYDRQNEIRNQIFSFSSRYRGSANQHYYSSRRQSHMYHNNLHSKSSIT